MKLSLLSTWTEHLVICWIQQNCVLYSTTSIDCLGVVLVWYRNSTSFLFLARRCYTIPDLLLYSRSSSFYVSFSSDFVVDTLGCPALQSTNFFNTFNSSIKPLHQTQKTRNISSCILSYAFVSIVRPCNVLQIGHMQDLRDSRWRRTPISGFISKT